MTFFSPQDHIFILRTGVFISLLLILAVIEFYSPRRKLKYARWLRWPSNLGISALNIVVLYIAIPTAAIGASLWAYDADIGLFNAVIPNAPIYVVWPACFLALDLIVYYQHYLFHRLPFLWPFHAMHHSDEDIDASSGVRFHPVEILISMLVKCAAIIVIGAPIGIVILFEITLNASALFTHANLNMPRGLDKLLRFIFVTPDMHRVHHSVIIKEQNSNFGFCLTWWDKAFKTYKDQPKMPHETLDLGLKEFQKGEFKSLPRMLAQPFLKAKK